MARTASVDRKTAETEVHLEWDLDGSGRSEVTTGVGFFDHMLELFAKHSVTDLTVHATGDTHVDAHHTVEDIGICLGQALRQAIGDKRGIRRYGFFVLPMEDALVTASLDLGGRFYLHFDVPFPGSTVGLFDTELVREFWQAVATNGQFNLHVLLHHGVNNHHISEAVFKATARALRRAIELDPRVSGVPSTKGTLG